MTTYVQDRITAIRAARPLVTPLDTTERCRFHGNGKRALEASLYQLSRKAGFQLDDVMGRKEQIVEWVRQCAWEWVPGEIVHRLYIRYSYFSLEAYILLPHNGRRLLTLDAHRYPAYKEREPVATLSVCMLIGSHALKGRPRREDSLILCDKSLATDK